MSIVVDPNPAIEGQPVNITVTGAGPHYWRTSETGWQTIPIDVETGRGSITMPAGSAGDVLMISDLAIPNPENQEVPINGLE